MTRFMVQASERTSPQLGSFKYVLNMYHKRDWSCYTTSCEFGLAVDKLCLFGRNIALPSGFRVSGCRAWWGVIRTGSDVIVSALTCSPFAAHLAHPAQLPSLHQTPFFSHPVGLARVVQDLDKDTLLCWGAGYPLVHSIVKHQVKLWTVLEEWRAGYRTTVYTHWALYKENQTYTDWGPALL